MAVLVNTNPCPPVEDGKMLKTDLKSETKLSGLSTGSRVVDPREDTQRAIEVSQNGKQDEFHSKSQMLEAQSRLSVLQDALSVTKSGERAVAGLSDALREYQKIIKETLDKTDNATSSTAEETLRDVKETANQTVIDGKTLQQGQITERFQTISSPNQNLEIKIPNSEIPLENVIRETSEFTPEFADEIQGYLDKLSLNSGMISATQSKVYEAIESGKTFGLFVLPDTPSLSDISESLQQLSELKNSMKENPAMALNAQSNISGSFALMLLSGKL